jgi:tetratricopeptide (TPR) repeat protein
MDNITIPRELINAVKEDNLILFTGAGLSYNFVNNNEPPKKLGNWNNLVNEILCNVEGLDYLIPLINKHEPIKILNIIEDANRKSDVITFVKKFLFLSTEKNDYGLHKKLCKLSNKIITTNYDNAFENAENIFQIKTAFLGKNCELNLLNDPFEKTLFKLHGCITDGSSMILFPSNYNNLYYRESEDAERIIFYLKNMIFSKTILFIGCGMGDFQINNIFLDIKRILGKFNAKKHYIIAKEIRLDSKLNDFLELISIDDFSKIEIIIDKLLEIKYEKNDNGIKLEKQLIDINEKLKIESDRLKILSLEYEKEGLELISEGNINKSIEKFKVSCEFDLNNDSAFNNWGASLYNLIIMKEDETLLKQAIEKFEQAVRINPRNDAAFMNLGCALSDLAKIKQDVNLFELACTKFKKANQIEHKDETVLYNWSLTLLRLGEIKQDVNIFFQVCEKCEQAIGLNPNNYKIYCNWGQALTFLAKIEQKNNIYEQAINKYEHAILLNNKYADAFYGLGNVFFDLAVINQEEAFCKQAIDKYEQAILINNDYANAFYNWGIALCYLANAKQDKIILEQAIEKIELAAQVDKEFIVLFIKKAYEILLFAQKIKDLDLFAKITDKVLKYGINAIYMLACEYIINDQKYEANAFLELCFKEDNHRYINKVLNDFVWKKYLEDNDFNKLINKYK